MLTEIPTGRLHELPPATPHPPWVARYLAMGFPELLRRARMGVDWSHERLAQQVIRVAARHHSKTATIQSLKISFSRFENGRRGPNMRTSHLLAEALDGAAPFFQTYETADGSLVVVEAIEPEFYAMLLDRLHLTDTGLAYQQDRLAWPQIRTGFAARFGERTCEEWAAAFADPTITGYVLPALTMPRALALRIEMLGLPVDRHFRW